MTCLSSNEIVVLEKGLLKGDPFAVLGMHKGSLGQGIVIRTVQPQAKEVFVLDKNGKKIRVSFQRRRREYEKLARR